VDEEAVEENKEEGEDKEEKVEEEEEEEEAEEETCRLLVDKVALEQVFLQILHFSLTVSFDQRHSFAFV
jgi:hypothetical protein